VLESSSIVQWEDGSGVVLLVALDLVSQVSDLGVCDWSDGDLGVR
jgi:hypothetical protein